MSKGSKYLTDCTFRVVEDAELPEDGRPIVVDPLAGDLILVIELKNRAHWKLDLTARAGQAAPHSVVGAAHGDLKNHGLIGHVTPMDVDLKIGKSPKQVFVRTYANQ